MILDTRTHRCTQCGGLATAPEADREDIRAIALHEIAADLEGCHEDAWRFWRGLIEPHVPVTSAIQLATSLGVSEKNLQSRFDRVGLPSLKKFTTAVALMRLAHEMEDVTKTALRVVVDLGWPAYPQSLSRLLHTALSDPGRVMTPKQFRVECTGRSMLTRLRRELVIPHLETWRAFRPIAALAAKMARLQPAGRSA